MLLILHRLVNPQVLVLESDSILLPARMFQREPIRVAYKDIQNYSDVEVYSQRFLQLSAHGRRYVVKAALFSDKERLRCLSIAMKKSHVFIVLTGFILGLSAICWTRAQAPSHPLKVMINGVEIHTLMSDQQNALAGYLEAASQTNALELFRQYRCAYSADLSASELKDTITILQYLRNGQNEQAIYNLEQHLHRYANLMCNSYGGLEPTNRVRVNLESLKQTRDYFNLFPHPEWGTNTETAMNEVLGLADDKAKK
jgi:hypothetical protein